MVLNQHGIETNFLQLSSRSLRAGFIPILLDSEIKFKTEKIYAYKKTFNAVFKNGFNSVLGSIPGLP